MELLQTSRLTNEDLVSLCECLHSLVKKHSSGVITDTEYLSKSMAKQTGHTLKWEEIDEALTSATTKRITKLIGVNIEPIEFKGESQSYEVERDPLFGKL